MCFADIYYSQDFLRNNRGINDGGDLPEEFMSALYDRIQTNEIKMKVHTWSTALHAIMACLHGRQLYAYTVSSSWSPRPRGPYTSTFADCLDRANMLSKGCPYSLLPSHARLC